MKPLLPKALRVNESKTQKHRVVMTHEGEEGILKNFENSRYQQDANEETSGRNQSLNGETRVYETNGDEHESQTHMLMVMRLWGGPEKESKEETQQLYIVRSGKIQSTQEFVLKKRAMRDLESQVNAAWVGGGTNQTLTQGSRGENSWDCTSCL